MTRVYGDHGLGARLGELVGGRHPIVAAATVTGRGSTVAAIDARPTAAFEIGSLSKGITGLLYADALARGEIDGTATLGDLLPLGPCPAAAVTLASLSTHSSGLPRLPASAAPLRTTIALWRHGTNPYGESLDELLVQARGVTPGRPRHRYSNFGFELLGHAIAAAVGLPFVDLLRDRVALPLGLGTLSAPATPHDLGPGALAGRSRSGRPRQPWTGEALAPAGGIRASITDLATLTSALLDGTAPGCSALDQVEDFGGPAVRIGAAWLTIETKGRLVTWHNGSTGGFSSWLGLDRAAGTGAVVLSATCVPVDRHGFDLLAGLGAGPPGG